jgi:hypothetical protein
LTMGQNHAVNRDKRRERCFFHFCPFVKNGECRWTIPSPESKGLPPARTVMRCRCAIAGAVRFSPPVRTRTLTFARQ